MPELRYYTIRQTREIKISAPSLLAAATLADRVFAGTMAPEDQINVQQMSREIDLHIEEDRT